MVELPDTIFRKWVHSFEEDTPDVAVYRPAYYNFPRARGRRAMEFSPDGQFIEYTIGPADVPLEATGRWCVQDPNRVLVSFDEAEREPFNFGIVRLDADRLKIRRL